MKKFGDTSSTRLIDLELVIYYDIKIGIHERLDCPYPHQSVINLLIVINNRKVELELRYSNLEKFNKDVAWLDNYF